MASIKIWISAFRLQTLPLALSCILMGSALALAHGSFRWSVFLLGITTTLFLQVLSNLANDLGDAQKGTDGEERLGPKRAVQSGEIGYGSMKTAVILFVFLSFISGVSLLYVSFDSLGSTQLLFLLLGIASIGAAIKYTVGKRAYGYSGLGDLFVFIFFGLIGVIGSFYLHELYLAPSIVYPAITIGLFSAGVLNLNNLRDIDNDAAHDKITLAVRLGQENTRYYHLALLTVGWSCMILYALNKSQSISEWLFLLSLPIFGLNLKKVFTYKHPVELIPSLKELALGTFVFTLLVFVGIYISHV